VYFSQIDNYKNIWKNFGFAWDYFVLSFIKLAKIRIGFKKKQTGKVNGCRILTPQEANDLMFKALSGDAPVFIGRNGGTESNYIRTNEMIKMGLINNFTKSVMIDGKDHSGIFPAEPEFSRHFAETYAKSIGNADITVYWGHILTEDFLLKKFVRNAVLIPSRALEPFAFEHPWTLALKNKKVLVVHPFEDDIIYQYANREKIFKNPDMLPEFKLLTLKAVQTLADSTSGFSDWFEALDFMFDQIKQRDFDIAIIGCGAYSMPLASMIKDMGKKAIVLGGMTQLLFGIKGSRWERSRPDIVEMYNNYWIRSNERPVGSERVEGNAYW
jgi:hypothetical protein